VNKYKVSEDRVDILLPTFNGSEYISELLNSIDSQSYKNIRLLMRDDASVDRTCEIIADYSFCVETFFSSNTENVGVVENINRLLEQSKSSYIMFADQDDVWLKDKVFKSIEEMKKAELKFGTETPIVVFTDAYIGDENLNLNLTKQSGSLLRRNGCFGYDPLFKNLIVQNTVSGCTMIINSALKKHLMPIPKEAVMHDWWIMLIASAMGKVVYLPDKTMIYRLHKNNTLGLRPISLLKSVLLVIKNPAMARFRIGLTYEQAKVFQSSYSNFLSENLKTLLDEYISLSKNRFFQRCRILWRNKFKKTSISKTIGFYLLS